MTQPPPPGPPPGSPPGLSPELLAAVRQNVPPKVAQAAQARDLGAVVHARKNMPLVVAGMGVVFVVGGFGLLAAVSAVGVNTSGPLHLLLRGIAVFLCFCGFGGIAILIRTAIDGARRVYLYQGGLVEMRNGRVRAVAYPEISHVAARYGKKAENKGKIIAYDAFTRDNQKIVVPGSTNRADDGFPGQLAWFVTQAGGRLS
jgi:hypothetical protein